MYAFMQFFLRSVYEGGLFILRTGIGGILLILGQWSSNNHEVQDAILLYSKSTL